MSRRFVNPNGRQVRPLSDLPRLFREPRTRWPSRVDVAPVVPPLPGNEDRALVTFIGHSTFLIQTHRGNIITDPVFATRVGPWGIAGPRRVRAPAVSLRDLPRIALILLSHNHYDHCDLASLRAIAARFDPHVVTPLGNAALLARAGIRKVTELGWWETADPGGFEVTATPAQHFSGRSLFDRNRALWAGFMVRVVERSIYFAGDSGYGPHFAEIHARLGAPDLALLPIGAYEPRWFMQDIHMNPAEAVRVHRELHARRSLAMHFGTFQLTPEGIEEPAHALAAAAREAGLADGEFVVPGFGGTERLR